MSENDRSGIVIPSWLWVVTQITLLLVFIILRLPRDFSVAPWVRIIGFILVIGGLFLGIIALLNLRKSLNMSPEPKIGAKFINQGIYRYIRHPMYTAVFMIVLGISINSGSYTKMAIGLVIVIFFVAKTQHEESLLVRRYPQYKEYMKTTGKFFPRIKL